MGKDVWSLCCGEGKTHLFTHAGLSGISWTRERGTRIQSRTRTRLRGARVHIRIHTRASARKPPRRHGYAPLPLTASPLFPLGAKI